MRLLVPLVLGLAHVWSSAQPIPPDFVGRISYSGAYEGAVSNEVTGRGRPKQLKGNITFSLFFNKGKVTGSYVTEGSLKKADVTGVAESGQCRLVAGPDPVEGDCDFGRFKGNMHSAVSSRRTFRVAFDTIAQQTPAVGMSALPSDCVAPRTANRNTDRQPDECKVDAAGAAAIRADTVLVQKMAEAIRLHQLARNYPYVPGSMRFESAWRDIRNKDTLRISIRIKIVLPEFNNFEKSYEASITVTNGEPVCVSSAENLTKASPCTPVRSEAEARREQAGISLSRTPTGEPLPQADAACIQQVGRVATSTNDFTICAPTQDDKGRSRPQCDQISHSYGTPVVRTINSCNREIRFDVVCGARIAFTFKVPPNYDQEMAFGALPPGRCMRQVPRNPAAARLP